MRVRYFGDLHLEFTKMKPRRLPSIGEDLVVLAGDIASGLAGVRWAQSVLKDRLVVYVLGNHEFYGRDFDELIGRARDMCAGSNVHLLEKDHVDLMGYRVLGCTLWTDFALYGNGLADDASRYGASYMPDYTEIRRAECPLTVQDTIGRCRESYSWLDARIRDSPSPLLIVTHHAPSACTMNPRYVGAKSSAAFHNAFDELIRDPVRAWIHGHTHYSVRKCVNGISVLTNQRGSAMDDTGEFNWEAMINLPSVW